MSERGSIDQITCSVCGRDATSSRGGRDSVTAGVSVGWWAQSLQDQDRHICGSCYRSLHPLEREGWLRPRAALSLAPALPVIQALTCLA